MTAGKPEFANDFPKRPSDGSVPFAETETGLSEIGDWFHTKNLGLVPDV